MAVLNREDKWHFSERRRSHPYLSNGPRELELWHIFRAKFTCRNCETRINAVRAGVSSDGIPLVVVPDGADDGAPDQGVWMAPGDWNRVHPESSAVGGEVYVINIGDLRDGNPVFILQEGGGRGLLLLRGRGCHVPRSENNELSILGSKKTMFTEYNKNNNYYCKQF